MVALDAGAATKVAAAIMAAAIRLILVIMFLFLLFDQVPECPGVLLGRGLHGLQGGRREERHIAVWAILAIVTKLHMSSG
jgi:hypothetical protein